MDSKTLVAALVGFVVNFLLGYLIYDMLLGDLYASHVGVEGLSKAAPLMWAIALGCLSYSYLLAHIFSKWAGIKTIQTGAKAGALIGLLIGVAHVSWSIGGTNQWDSPIMILIDGLVMAGLSGATGAAIGWWLGRE